jgi:hypothetical protein
VLTPVYTFLLYWSRGPCSNHTRTQMYASDRKANIFLSFSVMKGTLSVFTLFRMCSKPNPCFTAVHFTPFYLNAPYKFKPLNLRSVIFSFNILWLVYLRSTLFYGDIFYLRPFHLRLLFQERNGGVKQGLGVVLRYIP